MMERDRLLSAHPIATGEGQVMMEEKKEHPQNVATEEDAEEAKSIPLPHEQGDENAQPV